MTTTCPHCGRDDVPVCDRCGNRVPHGSTPGTALSCPCVRKEPPIHKVKSWKASMTWCGRLVSRRTHMTCAWDLTTCNRCFVAARRVARKEPA